MYTNWICLRRKIKNLYKISKDISTVMNFGIFIGFLALVSIQSAQCLIRLDILKEVKSVVQDSFHEAEAIIEISTNPLINRLKQFGKTKKHIEVPNVEEKKIDEEDKNVVEEQLHELFQTAFSGGSVNKIKEVLHDLLQKIMVEEMKVGTEKFVESISALIPIDLAKKTFREQVKLAENDLVVSCGPFVEVAAESIHLLASQATKLNEGETYKDNKKDFEDMRVILKKLTEEMHGKIRNLLYRIDKALH